MLTLISAERTHVVFEDEDGEEVNVTVLGGPLRKVVSREDYDLSYAWMLAVTETRKVRMWSWPSQIEFARQVRLAVLPEDDADVVFCESCRGPIWQDEALAVNDAWACQSCYDESYLGCDYCGDVCYSDDMTFVHDDSICSRCADRYTSYCEECDQTYHNDYADDHRHGGCDCESPAQHFMMRHGETTIAQDERFTATLPAGVISEEGMNAISRLIRNHAYQASAEVNPGNLWEGPAYIAVIDLRVKWWNLAEDVLKMDPTWQTKDGNFTKRLSKLAHKSQALKVPPALLTQVGNIGRDNSTGANLAVEMTRNLNLGPEEFYHEDSCWWQSYSESRCSLKNNGGIGMRTFDNGFGYERVAGRAWVQPLRLDDHGSLQPTFDAMTADAFMVYNGYGDLSGYVPARIVADMYGMTYRKVQFDMSPQYINNGAGYLVTTEEIAQKYPAGNVVEIFADTHSTLYHNEQIAARDAELVNA